MKSKLFYGLLLTCMPGLYAQPLIVDEVVAVIGERKVLYSDVEQSYVQMKAEAEVDQNTRCEILKDLMVQKLLVHQAEIDSVIVSESQVESELASRLRYFINVIGSEQKLEAYFGKSIIEIKEDLRDDIREQITASTMRNTITQDISVTPSEVRTYFRNLPEDSIPFVDAEVEYNLIALYPKTGDDAIFEAREKLLGLRERILNGESFAALAVIYSEDEGSAYRGGDIGWASRADLDAEYAKAAFALKKGAISKIVESSIGYHIIECIDRTDERVQTRHILIRPKVSAEARSEAITRLDSIAGQVRLGNIKFDEAARQYSEDADTKVNGGQAINQTRGGARWRMDEFGQEESAVIRNLNVGEISEPYESTDAKGKIVYKVIWLKSRSNPHRANLMDDYSIFKEKALTEKRNRIINDWLEEKIKTTYIRISGNFNTCTTELSEWFKI